MVNPGEILLFDLETDGLLEEVTKIHCGVVVDLCTTEFTEYRPGEIPSLIQYLQGATIICGHNILGFDVPALEKLHQFRAPKVFDTLVSARTWLPDRPSGHSLGSYGAKDTFGETADWKEYSEEMLAYCRQDVAVNLNLLHRLLKALELTLPDLLEFDTWPK